MTLDTIQRRVAYEIYSMVADAHPRRPVLTPVCECDHSDDQHFGVEGELHCGVVGCDCAAFTFSHLEDDDAR